MFELVSEAQTTHSFLDSLIETGKAHQAAASRSRNKHSWTHTPELNRMRGLSYDTKN